MRPTLPDLPRPVVVAVSGDGFDSAIRFGSAEAVRDGGPLHVVHVLGLDRGRKQRTCRLEPETATKAERIRIPAVERARELVGPDVQVTSEIFRGELVEGLVGLSRNARLVVLQRHARGAPRTDPRATSVKVAARATVPVACVPRDWTSRGLGTVTVGVDDPRSCTPLLREALLAAWSRGARLRILHVDQTLGEDDPEREIRSALGEAATALEDVVVSIEIIDAATPVPALVEAMETAELLVVGRHHPLVPRGSKLGPIARRVVRDASCPVLLLTPSSSTSSADWVFAGNLA